MTFDKKNNRTVCIAGSHFVTEKPGGVELQTRYLGQALSNSGWRVIYLSPSVAQKKGIEVIDSNIQVWWLPQKSYGFQYRVQELEEILDQTQSSVFYMRGRGQLQESGIVLDYAKKKAIPFVFALSSDTDLDFSSGMNAILTSHKKAWRKTALIPYALWSDWKFRTTLYRADCLLGQHENQARRIRRELQRESCILRTMHCEIDREIKKPPKNRLVWATNYRPWKQGELFLRLAQSLSEIDMEFVMIYGRTKKEYIDPILTKAQGLRNVKMVGESSPEVVEQEIEQAALFVNTSLPCEGFPNTFVQSWLRETPVVSLQVDPGGVLSRENVGICSGSFERMVEDVSHLIFNREKRMEMGKRARTYAEKTHGLQKNTAKINQLFKQFAQKLPCSKLAV